MTIPQPSAFAALVKKATTGHVRAAADGLRTLSRGGCLSLLRLVHVPRMNVG